MTYALWTSTPVSKEFDMEYEADLDNQNLAYMLAQTRGDLTTRPLEWRYAITDRFIRAYMSFSDDSLVFIDACGSLGSTSTLPDAFGEKHVSVLVGWTEPTGSWDRPDYFFDRLLGVNNDKAHPYENVSKPEPPNRPFDVDSVLMAMQAHGQTPVTFTRDKTTYTTHLVIRRLGGSFAILRPTIDTLVVHEDKPTLELWGMFGEEQGQVTIGGTEAAIETWERYKIIVTLPAADQGGGSGDVIVKVRKHESNAVPLTLWHVKFTYTEGPEQTITAYQHLYLDIYWRADVHRYRSVPDGELHDQDAVKILPADGSSGSWDCTWAGSYAGFAFTTETGSGELPFNREIGANGWTSSAKLDPENHEVSHLEFEMNFDPETICVVRSEGYGVSDTKGLGFVLLPSLLDEFNPAAPVTEPLKLDDQWMLVGANRDLMHDGMWPWLKWKDADPEEGTAPDPEKTEA
jgi:hypothetical protein